jgi:hypothetical protein
MRHIYQIESSALFFSFGDAFGSGGNWTNGSLTLGEHV